jgi:uncharacterized protein (DUF488 family)
MIFTIGYSNRSQPEFLSELQKRKITQLWDVRSSPWSRNAAFNGTQIERWTEKAGILYRQCGHVLGGRSDVSLDANEYVDLLQNLVAVGGKERLAIMCAEGDPALCHRSWSVGASIFFRWQVSIQSILRDGTSEPLIETLRRVRRSNFAPLILDRMDAQFTFPIGNRR